MFTAVFRRFIIIQKVPEIYIYIIMLVERTEIVNKSRWYLILEPHLEGLSRPAVVRKQPRVGGKFDRKSHVVNQSQQWEEKRLRIGKGASFLIERIYVGITYK